MEELRVKQKQEALKRMRILDIIEDAIEQFQKEETVMVSERPFGGLYELDDKQKEMVKAFEEEYGALVYLVSHTFSEFGELYELFHVSRHEEEWYMDNESLEEMFPFVYVVNVDCEYDSEFGYIQVKPFCGGVLRIS